MAYTGNSSPGWTYGYIPSALEWNTELAAKQDFDPALTSVVNLNVGRIVGNANGAVGGVVLATGLTLSTEGTLGLDLVAGTNVTITGGNTIAASGGTTYTAGHGVAINSGSIQVANRTTVAGGGTITITPGNGASSALVNGSTTTATTLNLGAPVYPGQEFFVEYKNGTTAQALNTGTSISYGKNFTTIVSTATAGVSDFLKFVAGESKWAFVGITQGFTL